MDILQARGGEGRAREDRAGEDRAGEDRARAQLARQAAAFSLGVPVEAVQASGRGTAAAAQARQVAMYLAHIAFEMSLARVALAFGRDRSTVAYACHKVEDMRDDPAFDARMDDLETSLRAMPAPGRIVGMPARTGAPVAAGMSW
ncbi:helix-turn-helix domain-containing protein [Glycocaulis abyssi]|uniref:Helix-turn-helix domain-containing protein n=1 Tax=Glycocaulis abyssi TaxID=1433403 RepID=A0ABV9N973_9PROT